MSNKSSIRKKKLIQRDSLSYKDLELSKRKLTTSFSKFTSSLNLKKVGSYFPVRNEASTEGIINHLEDLGIATYFPVISKDINLRLMKFAKYKKDNKLRENRFGIPEPLEVTFIDPSLIDLFLIPLLAFDNKGYRLGMGKGYYDTTLLQLKKSKISRIWGVAYEFQEEKNCFTEAHDLKLDAVLVPSGLRVF